MELEAAFTSVEVMRILASAGIAACRERVNQLADDLFGRDPEAWRKPRRITAEQMKVIREAFTLIDKDGFHRQLVVEMFTDPEGMLDGLDVALSEAKAGVNQFKQAGCTEERVAAIRRVENLRRLVAA